MNLRAPGAHVHSTAVVLFTTRNPPVNPERAREQRPPHDRQHDAVGGCPSRPAVKRGGGTWRCPLRRIRRPLRRQRRPTPPGMPRRPVSPHKARGRPGTATLLPPGRTTPREPRTQLCTPPAARTAGGSVLAVALSRFALWRPARARTMPTCACGSARCCLPGQFEAGAELLVRPMWVQGASTCGGCRLLDVVCDGSSAGRERLWCGSELLALPAQLRAAPGQRPIRPLADLRPSVGILCCGWAATEGAAQFPARVGGFRCSRRIAARPALHGHRTRIPPVPQSVADKAPHWTCKRCGRESYTQPQDLWGGLWLKARDGGPRRW
jgi:hypothetical protein